MAKIIQIGNSQGVRIPKALISLAELENRELDFIVLGKDLLITSKKRPRTNWSVAKIKIDTQAHWQWQIKT